MLKWCIFAALFLIAQQSADAKNARLGLDVLRTGFISGFLHQLDPLKLEGPFKLNIDEEQIKVHGSVDSLTINGLSEFTVDQWLVDAATSKIEFNLNFAKLTTTGNYNIDGLLINFFPLQGSGNFNVDVKDVRLTGSIKIETDSKKDISVKKLALNVHFGETTIKLDNIGKDSEIINEILSVVLVDLYHEYENKFKAEISESIKSVINQYLAINKQFHGLILANFSPAVEEIQSESRIDISSRVDKIFSTIRVNATQGGWDPIRLPSDSDEFSVSLFGATLNGKVGISNARIGGFSTIHRTGPCSTKTGLPGSGNTEITVFVGGNDIEIGLDFMWSAGIFKANLQIEMIVRHVDLKIVINRGESGISLKEFLLNEIGTVKITIGGIPGGGSDVISKRITLLSNLVKDSLIYAFQEALRPMVEKAITGPIVSDLLAEHLP